MSRSAQHRLSLSDVDIATMAARGDLSAKRVMVDRLFSKVRTTVHYIAPRDRDADDIVQLSLIEILSAAGGFRGECRMEVWAYRIVVRTAIRHLRHRSSHHRLMDPETSPPPMDPHTPEEWAEQAQLRARLKILLDKLPVAQRTAVVFRFVHGLTAAEIGDIMDIPLNTARERLRVGRKRLRKLIKRDDVLSVWIERMAP